MEIDWKQYQKQADAYLKRDVFTGTPLTGEVLAKSAKKTYEETGKYIPVDFALAQAQRESAMGRKGRSPKNNPYNVGEFDEGTKITFKNMEEGVQAYFDLIANDYLVDGKTTDDLMKNFVNKNGSRYATDTEYESYFQQQVPYIQKYLKKQTGFDLSSLNPFSATNAYGAEIPGQENTMPQTVQDPRQSLTLLQRLLTSPQAEAMFSSMTGEKKKSPYEEGVNKALKSLGEQQAIEAAQSGVPIQQIEQQTQKMTGNRFELPPEGIALLQQAMPQQQGQQQKPVQQKPQGYDLLRSVLQNPQQVQMEQQPNDLSSALAGQPQQAQTQEQQTQQQPTDTRDFLTKLFNAVGIKESARNELLRTQAALGRQELAGEKPLQEGRREELSMQFLNNVMQSSGQKTLSADAVKNLENAKTAVDQSTMLLNEFQNDPNLFKSWGGPGDARGQQVGFVIKNLSDTVGRLRSGGAINDEEMKTFRSFLPKQGFIKGNLEDKQTVMFKLQTINKLFDGIVKGIQPANEAADLANKIQEAIKSGYKPEEITKYLGF